MQIVKIMVCFVYTVVSRKSKYPPTSIIVSISCKGLSQKFWSGGQNSMENWSAGPLFYENFGPRVELWSERKYFGVS